VVFQITVIQIGDRLVMRFLFSTFVIIFLTIWSVNSLAGEIHKAARKGDSEKVKQLISTGTVVDEKTGLGETALYIASKFGHAELVKFLISSGADVNVTINNVFGVAGNSLHDAAQWGHIEVVKLLLEAGIKHDLYFPLAGTPYHLAKLRGHKEIAELIKKKGIEIRLAKQIKHKIATADVEYGSKLAKGCKYCHTLDNAKTDERPNGPPLWNVVGRSKASVPGYKYSNSLSLAGGNWNYDELNHYLANPDGYLPGTKKTGIRAIVDDDIRTAVIAYLRTLSDNPYPLPDAE
jgi:cytochrome c